MNRRRLVTFALLAAGVFATHPSVAQVIETSGVKFEPTLQIAGARLLLNGAGTRYKAVFRVYAAGLYLSAKATTPQAVLSSPGPRRLHIVMLREIDANELGKLFTRGMEDNAPREEFSKSIGGILKLSEIFSAKKKLTAGESFSVDWLPGVGTVILVNGKPAGEAIPEPEFYASLMKIWLGTVPADSQLKDALLGQEPVRRTR